MITIEDWTLIRQQHLAVGPSQTLITGLATFASSGAN